MPTEKAGESVRGWLVPKDSYPSRVFIVPSIYRSGGKRSLDFVVSAIGLVITAPICLVIAIAIRIDDGGAAVFTQERVGRSWHLFRIHKFRSMPVGNANVPSAHADALPITRRTMSSASAGATFPAIRVSGWQGTWTLLKRYGWFAVFWALIAIPVLWSNRFYPGREIEGPIWTDAIRQKIFLEVPVYVLLVYSLWATIHNRRVKHADAEAPN